MKHTELIKEEFEGEERTLALVGQSFFGGSSSELQLQIAQNGNDAYIDLTMPEVKKLSEKLHEWMSEKKEDHGPGINWEALELILRALCRAEVTYGKSADPANRNDNALKELKKAMEAWQVFRNYFRFHNDFGIK